jgi:hypothetical protein
MGRVCLCLACKYKRKRIYVYTEYSARSTSTATSEFYKGRQSSRVASVARSACTQQRQARVVVDPPGRPATPRAARAARANGRPAGMVNACARDDGRGGIHPVRWRVAFDRPRHRIRIVRLSTSLARRLVAATSPSRDVTP